MKKEKDRCEELLQEIQEDLQGIYLVIEGPPKATGGSWRRTVALALSKVIHKVETHRGTKG